MKVNAHFVKHGQFVHTVAWQAGDRRVLAVVPHLMRVDMERLGKAVGMPPASIKQRKLKDVEKETGFPTFVCPPFGHPRDAEGRLPLLLVDSSVTELKKPLLFDCGTVGLTLPVSELLRSTGAACVEGLAKPQEATKLPDVVMAPLPKEKGSDHFFCGANAAVGAISAGVVTFGSNPSPRPGGTPEPAPEPAPAAASMLKADDLNDEWADEVVVEVQAAAGEGRVAASSPSPVAAG